MNAKEAKDEATKRSKLLSEKQYEIIKDRINDAVNAGRFTYNTSHDELYKETREMLEKEGFRIKANGISAGSEISW